MTLGLFLSVRNFVGYWKSYLWVSRSPLERSFSHQIRLIVRFLPQPQTLTSYHSIVRVKKRRGKPTNRLWDSSNFIPKGEDVLLLRCEFNCDWVEGEGTASKSYGSPTGIQCTKMTVTFILLIICLYQDWTELETGNVSVRGTFKVSFSYLTFYFPKTKITKLTFSINTVHNTNTSN